VGPCAPRGPPPPASRASGRSSRLGRAKRVVSSGSAPLGAKIRPVRAGSPLRMPPRDSSRRSQGTAPRVVDGSGPMAPSRGPDGPLRPAGAARGEGGRSRRPLARACKNPLPVSAPLRGALGSSPRVRGSRAPPPAPAPEYFVTIRRKGSGIGQSPAPVPAQLPFREEVGTPSPKTPLPATPPRSSARRASPRTTTLLTPSVSGCRDPVRVARRRIRPALGGANGSPGVSKNLPPPARLPQDIPPTGPPSEPSELHEVREVPRGAEEPRVGELLPRLQRPQGVRCDPAPAPLAPPAPLTPPPPPPRAPDPRPPRTPPRTRQTPHTRRSPRRT